jgi:hypothetical protein
VPHSPGESEKSISEANKRQQKYAKGETAHPHQKPAAEGPAGRAAAFEIASFTSALRYLSLKQNIASPIITMKSI